MCRADQKLTKYFSFMVKKPELRRLQSMSFLLLPRSQRNLPFELDTNDNGLALIPEFSMAHPEHSLLSYHFNGSFDLFDDTSVSDDGQGEDILTYDFETCFEVRDEGANTDEIIIAYDLEECFAGLM